MLTEPVLIVWEDHHAKVNENEWGAPTPPADLKPLLIHSVGYVVSENETMVELARDVYTDEGDVVMSGPLRILKKCIVAQNFMRVKAG